MLKVRKPAVAGAFYPADPIELQSLIEELIDRADTTLRAPKALIVPHAGYIYSGPIAASGYALIKQSKVDISNVILLGPSHRVGFKGLAVSDAEQYESPLGRIPINLSSIEKISTLDCVHHLDQAHALEHSLEVHLPFLQAVLGNFTLMPIVAGDASPKQVCDVLDLLWGGPETLIIVSSDLSHYHDYDTARVMDRETSDAIEQLRETSLSHQSACGKVPVSGLLAAARKRDLKATTIDLRNSGDTAGPKDRVVGYGTYVFEQLNL